MTTATKRLKLLAYLAEAKTSKVNAAYTLLEADINDAEDSETIPAWQQKEVRRRLKLLSKNPGTAVSWAEAGKRMKALLK